jgi:hypothetical protein
MPNKMRPIHPEKSFGKSLPSSGSRLPRWHRSWEYRQIALREFSMRNVLSRPIRRTGSRSSSGRRRYSGCTCR